jgi:hypothetical protein
MHDGCQLHYKSFNDIAFYANPRGLTVLYAHRFVAPVTVHHDLTVPSPRTLEAPLTGIRSSKYNSESCNSCK